MSESYIIHLKNARKRAGFTQKEVEAKLGFRSLMIRDYEMGRLKLPVSIAIDLSKLYGISLDSLLGVQEEEEDKSSNSLLSFKNLFQNSGYESMFFDPVIMGALGGHEDEIFSISIFEILTKDMNLKKKNELVIEISKILNSLAGIDGKVMPSERACVNIILRSFNLDSKIKSISHLIGERYIPIDLPKAFDKNEVKHFVIWIMFFFAQADGNIVMEEVRYIDEIAQQIKVYRTNYLEIKKKFVKETV